MEVKNFQLEAVKERWPKYKDQIADLYYKDKKFRTICEDYYLCIQYMEKFKKEFSERLEAIDEYKKIQQELEKELQDRIDSEKTKK